MRRFPAAPLLLLAAACNAQTGEPAPAPAASHQVGETFDLRGQWGVSRLGGKTLEYRIALDGTADALIWTPGCAGWMLSYRSEGGALVFADDLVDRGRPVCDIGYPDDLPRVIEALQGRWTVAREENGDLELTRDGERIVLEKLPVDRVETLAGEWRVLGIDGQAPGEPLTLNADEQFIWWEPRCAGVSLPYRILNERFFWNKPPDPHPLPPGAEPPPPNVVCTIGIPAGLTEAMNALRAADRIERTDRGTVLISGGERSVVLAPAPAPSP